MKRSRSSSVGFGIFISAFSMSLKIREGGRTVNVHALIATGVNADGKREIL